MTKQMRRTRTLFPIAAALVLVLSSAALPKIEAGGADLAAPFGCVTPPANMVAWYPFDETIPPVANDIAGSTNNFGLYGSGASAPTPIPAMVANGLSFDGNDYVEVADHPEINFPSNCPVDAANPFSIDVWVRVDPNNAAGVRVILDKRSNSPVPVGYHLFLYNGRPGFQMADSAGFTNYVAPNSIAGNTWHLIAVTMQNCRFADGRIYVDGALVHTFVPRSGNLNNSANLQIGRRSPALGGEGFLIGDLDELEIINGVLSQGDIQAICSAGPAGKCK